jgi:hypothetical protein
MSANAINWSAVGAVATVLGVFIAFVAWRWPRRKTPKPAFVPPPTLASVKSEALQVDERAVRESVSPSVLPRIFVRATTKEICSLYEGRTTVQGDKLFSDFKGKWLRVSGTIHDIDEWQSAGIVVTLSEYMHPLLTAFFSQTEAAHLTHLLKKTPIELEGKLAAATANTLRLVDCAIVHKG